ncbi:DNA-directed RNA polymerase subunit beta [Deferribacterales bacterium RsTz2092]
MRIKYLGETMADNKNKKKSVASKTPVKKPATKKNIALPTAKSAVVAESVSGGGASDGYSSIPLTIYSDVKRANEPITRHSFSRIPKTIELPDFIEIQRNSFKEFMQDGVPADRRASKGLEKVFQEVFPIKDFNEMYSLEYMGYIIDEPKYTPNESIEHNVTYAAPLKIKARLITYTDDDGKKRQKDVKEDPPIYLCDLPLMTKYGTFIINGVERVVVSQLHRSPGIFFEVEHSKITDKDEYTARIIPYRGSWIDFEFDSKPLMYIRIDKKRKIPATRLLKALGMTEEDILGEYYESEKILITKNGFEIAFNKDTVLNRKFSSDLRASGEVLVAAGTPITKTLVRKLERAAIKRIPLTTEDLVSSYFATQIVDDKGELLAQANTAVTEEVLDKLREASIKDFSVLIVDEATTGKSIRETLEFDRKIMTATAAKIDIIKAIRPGEPITEESANRYFGDLFRNTRKYDISPIGRTKLNKRLGLKEPASLTTLSDKDIVETIRLLERVRIGQDKVDDIDHLGHRRVRSVGEQLQNSIRVGMFRMEKNVKEKMSLRDDSRSGTPQDLLSNSKHLSGAIREFFGSYQLSQFMDQINPLSEITHKRRLSALGPGGLNRDRAGFEVRDVHTSHYGRLCPIETPEGANIGLITSFTAYAKTDEYGFITTPYRRVIDGKIVPNEPPRYMTAIDEEEQIDGKDAYIAQANTMIDKRSGEIMDSHVTARRMGESVVTEKTNIQLMDVAPMQIVSVSAALIPFLEHDDANRALMGSNMQRQAVPLIKTDAPIVGTGLEGKLAKDSGSAVVCEHDGVVDYVDANKIIVRYADDKSGFGVDIIDLVKYRRSNQDTCINYRPTVLPGELVKKGDAIADGAATDGGELALGHNTVVALMPWMGYNYEDSILISQRVVKEDAFTSIHIEAFEVEARDTKLGEEEITRDIPNIGEDALRDLDDGGIIRIGAKVKEGDILVGKVTPKGETQATPEEKLLRVIFGDKAGNVKDASLRVPIGVEGTVIKVQVMTTRRNKKDDRANAIEAEEYERIEADLVLEKRALLNARNEAVACWLVGKKLSGEKGVITADMLRGKSFSELSSMNVDNKSVFMAFMKRVNDTYEKDVRRAEDRRDNRKEKVEKSDEMIAGAMKSLKVVLKSVRVHIAIKRKLSVGDKMAGRHGNKGVVSRILPEEDMPYLPDGRAVDIVLNPLSIPSRMNVGQVLEMHLGIASKMLGRHVATEVFDGAREEDIRAWMGEARATDEGSWLHEDGQTILYDGRTGEPFDQEVTVGVMYMLKLNHLVDTKLHARSTGPYALITQQPLGGKAKFGGQRFGEMEVWALYAYGAAHVLQEMLTVKSDDTDGRTDVFQAIVNGTYSFEANMPESFNVLMKELRGLGLDVDKDNKAIAGE